MMLMMRVVVALTVDVMGLPLMVYLDAATIGVFVFGVIHLKYVVSGSLLAVSDSKIVKHFNLQEAVQG
jgi:hypothetical protein